MKKQFLPLLLTMCAIFDLSAQCHTLTLPYGVVQTDISRGYKIIAAQDGTFVIAGEWNDEAFLMKVNAQGEQLILKKFGAQIGGQSTFHDVVDAPDGGFVAVGQCDNCTVPEDSMLKVIVIKTDANLQIDAGIGVKKFGSATDGTSTTQNERYEPVITRTGNTYTLAAGVKVGAGLNPQNTVITRLSENLDPVWEKMYNLGFFEIPYDIVATGDGFILPVNRAFLPQAVLLKIDPDGNMLWNKPFTIDPARNVVYLPATHEVVVIGERTDMPNNRDAFMMRFDAATGAALDSLRWGEPLGDEGQDVQLLGNGDLLAGVRTNLPNPFGIYGTSRIYRIQAHPLQVLCYENIPNPDNITNVLLTSIVPLSTQGKDYAVTGIRGFNNRTFFHLREDCEINYQSAAICAGETFTLPDGQTVSLAGIYQSTLNGIHGCDSLVQTSVTISTPVEADSVEIHADTGSGNGSISLQLVSGGTAPYTFLWSTGATGNAIGGLATGNYSVTLSDAAGCPAVFSFAVDLEVATSAPQIYFNFTVYPNPFAENLQVLLEMENATGADYSCRLIDTNGRVCTTFRLQHGVKHSVETDRLPSGVYGLQLIENEKVAIQQVVVKI
ncbi:MAG TPA: T9SS type A sorting domain-containing protein [Saprospiraceae bacterium]|nr:T9SS type A sorting domain-containing protein [Saprospiraceae bacterium]